LPEFEVVVLDPLLGRVAGARDQLVLDRLAFLHPQTIQDLLDALATEDTKKIVLQREVEARGARIALAAGAAAELVVDAARLVALGAHDVKPASGHDLLVLRVGDSPGLRQRRLARLGRRGSRIEAPLPEQLLGTEAGIAAEQNVGARSRPVRRDRPR